MARIPTLLSAYHDAVRVSVPLEAGERLERIEYAVQAMLRYNWEAVVLPDAVDAANVTVSGLAANTMYVVRSTIVDAAGVSRTSGPSEYMRTATVDAGQLLRERDLRADCERRVAHLGDRNRLIEDRNRSLEKQIDSCVGCRCCKRRGRGDPRCDCVRHIVAAVLGPQVAPRAGGLERAHRQVDAGGVLTGACLPV
jgi:hypothetical protein